MGRRSSRLTQQHERAPNPAELAAELDIGVEKVRDAPFNEGDETCLLDRLPGDGAPAPDTRLLAKSVKIDIERALRGLRPREAEIVRLYFGLGGERSQNLAEIGGRLGLTRERVRQIKDKALRELRRKYPRLRAG